MFLASYRVNVDKSNPMMVSIVSLIVLCLDVPQYTSALILSSLVSLCLKFIAQLMCSSAIMGLRGIQELYKLDTEEQMPTYTSGGA